MHSNYLMRAAMESREGQHRNYLYVRSLGQYQELGLVNDHVHYHEGIGVDQAGRIHGMATSNWSAS